MVWGGCMKVLGGVSTVGRGGGRVQVRVDRVGMW